MVGLMVNSGMVLGIQAGNMARAIVCALGDSGAMESIARDIVGNRDVARRMVASREIAEWKESFLGGGRH